MDGHNRNASFQGSARWEGDCFRLKSYTSMLEKTNVFCRAMKPLSRCVSPLGVKSHYLWVSHSTSPFHTFNRDSHTAKTPGDRGQEREDALLLPWTFVGESGSVTLQVTPGAHFNCDSFTTHGLKNYSLSIHNRCENDLLSLQSLGE